MFVTRLVNNSAELGKFEAEMEFVELVTDVEIKRLRRRNPDIVVFSVSQICQMPTSSLRFENRNGSFT